MPYLLRVREASFVPLYPTYRSCSRSFGLRSSYEIDILDTDQRPGTLDCWTIQTLTSRKSTFAPDHSHVCLTSGTSEQKSEQANSHM